MDHEYIFETFPHDTPNRIRIDAANEGDLTPTLICRLARLLARENVGRTLDAHKCKRSQRAPRPADWIKLRTLCDETGQSLTVDACRRFQFAHERFFERIAKRKAPGKKIDDVLASARLNNNRTETKTRELARACAERARKGVGAGVPLLDAWERLAELHEGNVPDAHIVAFFHAYRDHYKALQRTVDVKGDA